MTPSPHPVRYAILYFPFGALGGFVTVALTFLATRHGLSISQGALFAAVGLVVSYLKWIWAPVVDVTLSPKRWYRISTGLSALSVVGLAIVPISETNLPLLLGIVAVGTLVNSVVGMAVEAIMAAVTPPSDVGRVSGWFQVGNLGGNGVGGGLGLLMLQHLPEPWMAGAIVGASFLACWLALAGLPDTPAHKVVGGVSAAVSKVFSDIKGMGRSQGGLLAAIICALPLGTGAAQGVLTQAAVSGAWGAGDTEVALIQGVLAGVVMAVGCLAGGYVCQRFHPRTVYAVVGLALGVVALGMAFSPRTVTMFVTWSMIYSFGVGMAYSAFTAVVLGAMGSGSAATKYNLYASLSNFPIWWLGLLLAGVAQEYGEGVMLGTEAVFGALAVVIFVIAHRMVTASKLPVHAEA